MTETRPGGHSERPTGSLRFAVLQLGARMHYAVPTLLERADMLCHFYTDAVGNLGLTGTVGQAIPAWARSSSLKRLLSRRIPPEIPLARITTAQHRALKDAFLKKLVPSRAWPDTALDWLRKRMAAEDFRGANALYCLDNSDLDLMQAAKARGMAIVYEQVIAPQVGRILREERTMFPGLENQDSSEWVEEGIRRDNAVWNLVDLVLAPSEFVRQGMVALGANPGRIKLVPYGLPETWYGVPSNPIPGRVLFVGSVGLRKGNHYLAQACKLLRERGVSAQFRVVGRYSPEEVASPLFAGPEYVGLVPRSQIQKEFSEADVFAFPTIAEGFALVHLEAMASGVPVVTTPNCGPAVRDGQDGFIVPMRDAIALADRLQAVITDRALRQRLSESARIRAAEYSWANYRNRLISALEDVRPAASRP